MVSPRMGQPAEITSFSLNELLSMLCCIIRYRGECCGLRGTDAIAIHRYFLLQAPATDFAEVITT